ncbi:MAG: purine-nucleoside phosphorylase [Acidimicrobiia bacterium]|nr:purine-nucleoside phosphorylase [Acidimicrobiia bacterium]
MTTPHISAEPGDFAATVLMPGDPQRARFIAEEYLDDTRLVTDVRNMWGYTGTVDGRAVSVMGHGMGIPSVCIYATELIRFFGCTTIIRVGSCGSLIDDLALGDVIIATAAGTDSAINRLRLGGLDFPAVADFELTRAAVDTAADQGLSVRLGPIFSSDVFYGPDGDDTLARAAANGLLAVEMEAAGLYGVATAEGARALTLLTVSDRIGHDDRLSPEARATGFDAMIRLALGMTARI